MAAVPWWSPHIGRLAQRYRETVQRPQNRFCYIPSSPRGTSEIWGTKCLCYLPFFPVSLNYKIYYLCNPHKWFLELGFLESSEETSWYTPTTGKLEQAVPSVSTGRSDRHEWCSTRPRPGHQQQMGQRVTHNNISAASYASHAGHQRRLWRNKRRADTVVDWHGQQVDSNWRRHRRRCTNASWPHQGIKVIYRKKSAVLFCSF